MKKRKLLLSLLLSLGFFLPSISCATLDTTIPPSNEIENSTNGDLESSTEDSSGSLSNSSSGSSTGNSSNNSSGNSSGNSSNNSTMPPSNPKPPASNDNETTTPPTQNTKAQYIRCKGDNVNIRAGAGTDFSVLGVAEKDTMYAVIGKTGNWYKTYYKNKIAYLYAEYVSVFTLEKAENDTVEKVVAEGYKTIGVPYVYGAIRIHDGKGNLLKGFTPQKFDCSSLVQYAFYKGAGTLLDVTTRTQIKQGKSVSKANLQRGDCLFFTNEDRQYNTGIERVGHVAIYLGNDYILHTASDYARIEKLSTKRWSFFLEARRFL